MKILVESVCVYTQKIVYICNPAQIWVAGCFRLSATVNATTPSPLAYRL